MHENKRVEISTKLLVKSSFWYTAATFFTRAIAFITIPIFTRLLTKAQFGDFTNFASWQNIFLVVCGLEVYGTINRARFDYTGEGELDSYITSCLVLSGIITTTALTLYLVFPHIIYDLLLIDSKYMPVLFLYLYTYPAYLMFQAKQRIEYRYKLNAAVAFTVIIVSSLTAILLVNTWETDRLMGRIVGQYVPFIIAGLTFYIYYCSKSLRIRRSCWAYALQLGLPLVFSYMGSSILLHSDNIIVKHMSTADAVGNLSIAHSCAHITLIFVHTLAQAWSPWFFDKLNIKAYDSIRKILRIYLWVIVFFTFCVIMVGPEIVSVLGGAKYKDAVYLLPPTMLCGVFATLTNQFVGLETFHKRNRFAAEVTALVAVLNIAIAILGVKIFGYIAVCYAMIISYIVLILSHYIYTIKMGIREILPFKDLVSVLVVSLVIVGVSLLLYMNIIIRCVVIAVLAVAACVILWIKRAEVRGLIKRFRRKDKPMPSTAEENATATFLS